jgi:tRNA-dihydrouridine synthase
MYNKENTCQTSLYIAPLQGFTDCAFRAAFCTAIGRPDAAFSPFIETHKPDARMYRDVIPEKNSGCRLIPQILGNKAEEMLPVIEHLQQLGYDEINWNLGCPYPMVTRRQMGAGLLPYPDKIEQILKELFARISVCLSVKMRLGFENKEEIQAVIPVLNDYPFSEVIVHGRTATQMYNGENDLDAIVKVASQMRHPVCYNGDLFSLEKYQYVVANCFNINRFMLGRGLLSNPLLLQEIKTDKKLSTGEVLIAIRKLHEQLVYQNSQRLSGSSHFVNKMKPYWEYFALSLPNREKELRKVRKATTIEGYLSASAEALKY